MRICMKTEAFIPARCLSWLIYERIICPFLNVIEIIRIKTKYYWKTFGQYLTDLRAVPEPAERSVPEVAGRSV